MTDRERLKALFKDLDIPFKDKSHRPLPPFTLRVTEGANEKVDGYSGFIVDFTFDADGKFLKMGIWE